MRETEASRSRRLAPAGSWRSPLAAAQVADAGLRLAGVTLDGEDAWWAEGRPREGGRVVLVRERDGRREDRLPAPWSARSRVHEYGGGAFAVRDGVLWFVNDADQRIHEVRGDATPRALTPNDAFRYADLEPDPARARLICVCEDHRGKGEASNRLVAVDLDSGGMRVLATGRHDFVAAPRVSPDGTQLAWLAWDHPHMPWRGARLWLADFSADGDVVSARVLAGDGDGASVSQPAWAPDGSLWFVHEPDGWWNLHRFDAGGVRCMLPMAAEFAQPHWTFGNRCYGFDAGGGVVCGYVRDGRWRLGRLHDGQFTALPEVVEDLGSMAVGGQRVLLLGGGARQPESVISFDLASGARRVLRSGAELPLDDSWLAAPSAIEFPSGAGEQAHGLYYAPCNPDHALPAGELPPLIVTAHGGPTGAASRALDARVRFWTSRGLAVLDLDYRGSTGYGRAYRDSLAGRWGVADVEDAVAGARHLAANGCVDGARMAIRGSSAGGYLALAAVTFHEVFAAAAVWYGISDLEVLARDTHKFESRYLEWLIGPWPERADLYRQRSPIHHAARIRCPLLVLQGLDDRVVPPNQAAMLVETVRANAGEVDYETFEGEGHGFRRAETLRACLARELAFYGRVFGFEGAA